MRSGNSLDSRKQMLIHILIKECIMFKLIKGVFLNTLIVFLAEFVVSLFLGVMLHINILPTDSLSYYYPLCLGGACFLTGFFLIRNNYDVKGSKRVLFFFISVFSGHFLINTIFNMTYVIAVKLFVSGMFCWFIGILIREISFPAKKYIATVLILVSLLLILSPFQPLLKNEQPEKKLIEYIKNDETEKAKALIEKGADVNHTDENGATPAMWAAAGGNFDILKLLIAKGADINKKGLIFLNVEPILFYTTVLNAAIGQGHLEIVKFLVEECGVDVNEISPKINRITYYPQDIPDPQKILEYIKNKDDFSSNIVKDYTKGFPESTLPLMISGALNKILTTRLSRKSEGGNLFKKALAERKKLDEEFPGLVRNRKHYEIFDETDGIWVPNITYAAGPNFIEITKYLIEKGININQRDQDNISALFFTAKDTALLLLGNGAEVNVKENLMNSSPLGLRARFLEKDMTDEEINLWKKIVETFVQKGADINSQDKLGDTLLHNMCLNKNSSADLVAFVVKLGADPEIKDNWGKTAKEICAEHGIEIKNGNQEE